MKSKKYNEVIKKSVLSKKFEKSINSINFKSEIFFSKKTQNFGESQQYYMSLLVVVVVVVLVVLVIKMFPSFRGPKARASLGLQFSNGSAP